MVRRRIVFQGDVQGVGFRWRAEHAAALYRCTGWCANEWDGSVTMEIQGGSEDIDRVVEAIRGGRYVRIESMQVTSLPPDPDERSFHIR